MNSPRDNQTVIVSEAPPFRRPSALLQHARSVHALLLRNIKTRAGASYLGFLFAAIIPLAHIGILMAIYGLVGRRAPIGNDITMYLVSAILPFVIWSYTHKDVIRSLSENKSLLYFPSIKVIDVVMAAVLAEILHATLIVTVTLFFLTFIASDMFIFDKEGLFFCLLSAYLLGVSTGAIFAVLGSLAKPILLAGYLLIPLYWITSGNLFIPAALPQSAQTALFFFPIAHIVDLARETMFPGYISDFHNMTYVYSVIIGNFLAFFVLSRVLYNTIAGK